MNSLPTLWWVCLLVPLGGCERAAAPSPEIAAELRSAGQSHCGQVGLLDLLLGRAEAVECRSVSLMGYLAVGEEQPPMICLTREFALYADRSACVPLFTCDVARESFCRAALPLKGEMREGLFVAADGRVVVHRGLISVDSVSEVRRLPVAAE